MGNVTFTCNTTVTFYFAIQKKLILSLVAYLELSEGMSYKRDICYGKNVYNYIVCHANM